MSPHMFSESKDASIQGQFAAQEQNCSNSYFFFLTMYGSSCHLNEQLAVYHNYTPDPLMVLRTQGENVSVDLI